MRNFNKLWLHVFFYKIADWIRIITVPLVIYERTGSSLYMAWAYGISFIPWLFSLFGGVISDKYAKLNILKCGSLLSTIIMLCLFFYLKQADFNIYILFLFILILSAIDPFTHPAEQSLIPLIVNDDKELVAANSSLQIINNTLSTIGPIAGGIISSLLSTENAMAISFLFFLLSLMPVFLIKCKEETLNDKKSSLISDIKAGVKATLSIKFVLYGSILFFFTNFAIHIFQANFMYFMVGKLNYSTLQAGISLGIAGFGAILGSFFAKYLNHNIKMPAVIIATSTVLAGISMLFLYQAENYIYIGFVLAITYFLGSINVVTYFSSRQKMVPQQLLGRVVSITRLFSFLSIPIGAFIGGILINDWYYSIYTIIILSAVIRLLAGIMFFLLNKKLA